MKMSFKDICNIDLIFCIKKFKIKINKWGPERWWTILGKDKVRGNSDGSS